MGREEDRKLKEILLLRIEYLKQSTKYKAYCEWKRKLKTYPKSTILSQTYPKILRDPPNNKEISEKNGLKYVSRQTLYKWLEIEAACARNFVIYGDIHDIEFSFEKWWEQSKVLIERSNDRVKAHLKNSYFRSVTNGTERIGKEIDACISKFVVVHGREPNLQEFKNSFVEMLKGTNHIRFYVEVHPFFDRPKIEKEFKEILRERMKDPKVKHIRAANTIYPSTNFLRLPELKRHLDIYIRLEGGEKVTQIIRTDNHYKNHEGDRERQVRMDREKARRIIKFTESGIFPGPYETGKAKNS